MGLRYAQLRTELIDAAHTHNIKWINQLHHICKMLQKDRIQNLYRAHFQERPSLIPIESTHINQTSSSPIPRLLQPSRNSWTLMRSTAPITKKKEPKFYKNVSTSTRRIFKSTCIHELKLTILLQQSNSRSVIAQTSPPHNTIRTDTYSFL